MSLEIHTTIVIATWLAALGAVVSLLSSIRAFRTARRLPFFRMRRARLLTGWKLLFAAAGLSLLSVALPHTEPVVYHFYRPSPTPTLTPTITPTPTMTPIPSVTPTPTVTPTLLATYTPTPTPTPYIPLAIAAKFTASVTPNPDTVFSPLVFTQGLDLHNYKPLHPGTVFKNPVGHLYAVFTYDKMDKGVQWTAIWYRNGEIVHFETKAWTASRGGYGFTDWNPPPSEWLPGTYQVVIFVGQQWKVSGTFTVEGEPPTPAPTATPTSTFLFSPTPSLTPTPTPTFTPTPTRTPYRSPTPSPTTSP